MGIIRTVQGDIDADQLGICLPHEHLLGMPPQVYADQDPDLILDSVDKMLSDLQYLKQAGVSALVEMTPIDYHRDPTGLLELSQKSDVHVICVTGFLKDKFCADFVRDQSVDDLARLFIKEIQGGIEDTGIRAGVIKAASSLNVITDNEKKVFLAAAIAQQETGVLISTHTEAGTMALEQIDLLVDAGVKPDRILIGHLDRRMDWDYHCEVATRGVYMGYDQISKAKYYPDELRAEYIKRMISAGAIRQLMLSQDLARRSNFSAYGGQVGHAYLMREFVPILKACGVVDAQIDIILSQNPREALLIV